MLYSTIEGCIFAQNINNIIYALLVQQAFTVDTVNIEIRFLLSCIAHYMRAPSCKLLHPFNYIPTLVVR